MQPDDIGILGGTFDPVHDGHIALAYSVLDALGIDELRFMPTGTPNFKQHRDVTPAAQRVAMLELAIADEPRFVLDAREVERGGVTYTADTLESLSAEFPGARLNFVIGADAACTLPTWRRAARLAELARFVVALRGTVTAEQVRAALERGEARFDVLFIDIAPVDVSSTGIREAIACGQRDIAGLPPAVLSYIREQGLYASGRES